MITSMVESLREHSFLVGYGTATSDWKPNEIELAIENDVSSTLALTLGALSLHLGL